VERILGRSTTDRLGKSRMTRRANAIAGGSVGRDSSRRSTRRSSRLIIYSEENSSLYVEDGSGEIDIERGDSSPANLGGVGHRIDWAVVSIERCMLLYRLEDQ
jgi:hypothetical protein